MTPRAEQLSTRREVWAAFIRCGSPRILLALSVGAITTRLAFFDLGTVDAIAVAITLALVGPFEWLVHRFLLHAPAGSFRMRVLGTGSGHAEHHHDPGELRWLLLSPGDAALFAAGLAAVIAAWAVPLAVVGGASIAGLVSTAWCIALAALLHYEWTHLLVHSRYRCRSRHYRALANHHRLHHYRNERYWLGVTARTGDRFAGTMPPRGDVELSPTARTVDRDQVSAG